MPIVETGNRAADKQQYKEVASHMERLTNEPGWKLLAAYLDGEIANAFNEMQSSRTGDGALRASAAYVVMRNIRDWPLREAKVAISRIDSLMHEEQEEVKERVRNQLRPGRNVP